MVLCSVTQLSLTLRDPMDCSPPGPSVHGILQARTLEWVAISFSKRNYRKKENEATQPCLTFGITWTEAYQPPPAMEFSRQEYWSGFATSCPEIGHMMAYLV